MALRELTDELSARYMRAGVWQDRTIAQIVAAIAAEQPDREAVCDQTRRLSYAQLVLESGRLAAFLRGAGVRDGDAVAIQSGNRVELAVAHLACSTAGATFVPMSDAWRQTEMSHILSVSRAVLALVPPAREYDHLGAVEAVRSDLPSLALAASADGVGEFDLRSILRGDCTEPLAPASADPNLPRYVMVSSGSTSLPKLSLWSDNNLWAHASAVARAVALSFKDRVLGLAPAGTGAIGYMYGVLLPLLRGATSILLERWGAPAALELMRSEQPTVVAAVPTQLVKLMQEPGVEWVPCRELRAVTNAGAPMPADVAARLEDLWSCRIQTTYGATDGGVPVMTGIDDPAAIRRTTVGRALPETDIRLVDGRLKDVQAGHVGEIAWRGPTKSHGYLNDPERTDEMFCGEGYYRSGDLAQRAVDGSYRIVGRAKDMIIRGGQNISPLELEEAIGPHPAVAEVAVVGIADEVYGERVCVAASVREGQALGLDELVTFLAEQRIAKFKLPERLELFDELPKTATGKTSKDEIRRLVSERHPAGR
jgi:non-ribosomal peptide synthetase component E (peptide arylation enzyme)